MPPVGQTVFSAPYLVNLRVKSAHHTIVNKWLQDYCTHCSLGMPVVSCPGFRCHI
ncbi:hypothetical protein PISMIDRAFT_620216 [Pisolithus microcarpus 441]|uniref:Uncharacterized protein n=1 Tax=Pisolithus microcarpus 441 TaxID=765257 RepID=A0A0C9Y4S3_9AGAM|nr:hypothetical protein PISMIDRAFT_620216 [Pisolithus microcarpus 441]